MIYQSDQCRLTLFLLELLLFLLFRSFQELEIVRVSLEGNRLAYCSVEYFRRAELSPIRTE